MSVNTEPSTPQVQISEYCRDQLSWSHPQVIEQKQQKQIAPSLRRFAIWDMEKAFQIFVREERFLRLFVSPTMGLPLLFQFLGLRLSVPLHLFDPGQFLNR